MKELILQASDAFWGSAKATFDSYRSGQTNLVGLFIGILIAAIVGFQVAIPVIQDAYANLSGTNRTIAEMVPLFIVLLVLIALASPVMRRVG